MNANNQNYYKYYRGLSIYMALSLIIIWVSASLTICYAITVTKSLWCLLIYLILPTPKITHRNNDEDNNEERGNSDEK